MVKPLYGNIKEDLPLLKSCLKKQPPHLKSQIQMLIILKKFFSIGVIKVVEIEKKNI